MFKYRTVWLVQVINAEETDGIDIDIPCLEEKASVFSIHATGFAGAKIKEMHAFSLIRENLNQCNKYTVDHSSEICMIERVNKLLYVLVPRYGREGNMKRKIIAEKLFLEILLIVVTGNSVFACKFLVQGQQKIQEKIKGIAEIISVAPQPSFCYIIEIFHCHIWSPVIGASFPRILC